MLPVMKSEAVRVPAAEGVKVMLIVQLAPAAIAESQVFVCAKSALFAPPNATMARFKAAAPVLVNLTVCVGLVAPIVRLPKFRLVTDKAGTCTKAGFERAASVTVNG